MLLSYEHSATSVILRVKLLDSSATDGSGLTGLAYNSSGLIISTIANNEATATAYTAAGATIEDITTLGTFAAPTASKCRFKQVDATNHPGLYEIQLADARFAVSSARYLTISVSGATNLAECDFVVQLGAKVDVRAWGGAAPNALQSGRVDSYTGAMGSGVVSAAAVGTGAIDADAIAASAITDAKIASGALTSAKFATGAITADGVAAGAITASTFATGAIDAAALAADAGTEIAAAVLGATVESEGTVTLAQATRLMLAVLAGETTVSGATYTVLTSNGIATRVTFTLNASKERTAVTLNP